MNKTPYNWKSSVSPYIKGFIDERHLAGYRFKVQDRWVKQFDRHCFDKGICEEELTKNLLEEFCAKNRNESMMIYQNRLRLMRQFAKYLLKIGYSIKLPLTPDKTFSYPRHNPYIFTEHELRELFVQIDNWIWTSQSRGYRRQIDQVLFRMIYGCGLRIMEALHLKVADINIKEGYLCIRNSKNGRNRIVPMAESLVIRCKAYSKKMHALSSPDDYYFPGSTPGSYSSHSSTYHRFRQYLWKAGIPHTGHGPRIHDLRYPNLNKIQTFFKYA